MKRALLSLFLINCAALNQETYKGPEKEPFIKELIVTMPSASVGEPGAGIRYGNKRVLKVVEGNNPLNFSVVVKASCGGQNPNLTFRLKPHTTERALVETNVTNAYDTICELSSWEVGQ